jgi:hypothetical protein
MRHERLKRKASENISYSSLRRRDLRHAATQIMPGEDSSRSPKLKRSCPSPYQKIVQFAEGFRERKAHRLAVPSSTHLLLGCIAQREQRIHVRPGPANAVAVHLVFNGLGYVVNEGSLSRSMTAAWKLVHTVMEDFDCQPSYLQRHATITPVAAERACVLCNTGWNAGVPEAAVADGAPPY